MPKLPQLWKTDITIWTDYPPTESELEDLARDATSGDAYCSKQVSKHVSDPEKDPDWDGTEFFNQPDEEEEAGE